MPDERTRATLLVSGHVQGVGYRAFARRHALDLGIAGSVENLGDGRVEVIVEGPRSEIQHLMVALRRGPAHASVADIQVAWSQAVGLKAFNVL